MLAYLLTTTNAINVCNYQQRICECDRSESECHFSLIIEDLLSLTSYPLVVSESGKLIRQYNGNSVQYYIKNNSVITPVNENLTGVTCDILDERFSENNCSIPMTIDSVGNGKFLAVNGLIPGPTLIVNLNQTLVVDVRNMLFNKEISIHWHGLSQNNTPWMDGVDHITQCPIPTYASFRYIFKASPSGTMWYHSHVGTERTAGLFGALIVREDPDTVQKTQDKLQTMINETFAIVDNPEHTLSFLDWNRDDGVEVTLKAIGRNPFYSSCDENPADLVPPPLERRGPDGTIISRITITAGLINGFGIQKNISYMNSRLEVLNVQYYNVSSPVFYRFRLVGAQRHDMFNFSISDHTLYVVSTDGYLTEPIEVDYIFIHAGERYDFLLKPKTVEEANGTTNYLVSADKLDGGTIRGLAFLHYGDKGGNPKSTEYEEIINSTVPRQCNEQSMCYALNCPFESYALNSFIKCLPVTDMRLLFPTPNDNLPTNNRDSLMSNEYFFDFSFTGSANSAAINGRNFAFPGGALQTQLDNPFQKTCKSGYFNCSTNRSQCICLHIVNITKPWETIQFVLTNIGSSITNKAAHPVHLHGHSFHVVGIYYGEYNSNGTLTGNNPNVTCGNDTDCTNPEWTSAPVDGSVTSQTVRKDTVVVPPGGYVVIRFISNNWGFWYMHCHIETHFLEGMTLVVNEGYEFQNQPPLALSEQQCGDFSWTVEEFDERLNNPIERESSESVGPFCPGEHKL